MNKSQTQTLLNNNILQAASETVSANHRVTAKPFVPSGPRGCRTMLSPDEHSLFDEHCLLTATASQLLLCPNLLTINSDDIQLTYVLLNSSVNLLQHLHVHHFVYEHMNMYKYY